MHRHISWMRLSTWRWAYGFFPSFICDAIWLFGNGVIDNKFEMKKHTLLSFFFCRLVLMIVKFLWFFRWKFSRNQMQTILESELKWSHWKDDKIKQILYHAITLSRSICCLFPNSAIANNDYKWLLCHNNCTTRDIVYNV